MSIRLRTARLIGRILRRDERHRHARRLLCCCAIAVPLAASTASSAARYATRTVGAWVVSASSDQKGCFLSRTYPSPRETTLQFGLDTDGGNRLTVLNANWSIRPREPMKMDFRLSNAAFPRHVAIGIAIQGKKGFVTSFGRTFPATLAASRFLHVRRGEVPVEELGLDGSGAAIAELRKCVDQYRDRPGAVRPVRDSDDRIPVDPFATGTRRESRK